MSALAAAPTVVRGELGAGCTVASGVTAYTATKTGTGKCAITFTPAFAKPPVVVVSPIADVSGFMARLYDLSTTTQAFVKNTTQANAATDAVMDFIAMDPTADLGGGGAGATGPAGPKGDPGDSAYKVWLDAGHTGTEADFLASLKGEKGDPGEPGPAGDGSTSSGTVDTTAVVSAITRARDYAHADLWWLLGLMCALFFGYFLYRAVTPRA